MFGQNELRKRESHPNGLLQVQDIWYTLQGEGPFTGHPAVFIRLTGCNLACWFCDTKWDDQNDPYMDPEHIARRAMQAGGPHCQLVVLTGGEPARQDLRTLIPDLARRFDIIQIETAGTLWQDCLDHPSVRIVCSPKTPKIHPRILAKAHAFKYVIRAEDPCDRDGLPLASTQFKGSAARLARPRPGAPVYLSPCDEYDQRKNADNLRMVTTGAKAHGYIAGIQLHKILGVD